MPAEPLHPAQLSAFLQRVAELLNGQEIGEGTVARAAREAQRRYWEVPETSATGGRIEWPAAFARGEGTTAS
jgi:hypothetical protein